MVLCVYATCVFPYYSHVIIVNGKSHVRILTFYYSSSAGQIGRSVNPPFATNISTFLMRGRTGDHQSCPASCDLQQRCFQVFMLICVCPFHFEGLTAVTSLPAPGEVLHKTRREQRKLQKLKWRSDVTEDTEFACLSPPGRVSPEAGEGRDPLKTKSVTSRDFGPVRRVAARRSRGG